MEGLNTTEVCLLEEKGTGQDSKDTSELEHGGSANTETTWGKTGLDDSSNRKKGPHKEQNHTDRRTMNLDCRRIASQLYIYANFNKSVWEHLECMLGARISWTGRCYNSDVACREEPRTEVALVGKTSGSTEGKYLYVAMRANEPDGRVWKKYGTVVIKEHTKTGPTVLSILVFHFLVGDSSQISGTQADSKAR